MCPKKRAKGRVWGVLGEETGFHFGSGHRGDVGTTRGGVRASFFLSRFKLDHYRDMGISGKGGSKDFISNRQPGFNGEEIRTPLRTFLVHYSVTTLSATNRFTRPDLVFRATICFQRKGLTIVHKGIEMWARVLHLHKGTPFQVFDP